jgi:putative PIN family toxin of toxin-antitoxin system
VGAESTPRIALVLDSNVVLNWLFFNDPPTIALVNTLLTNHQWVSTAWMQREALRVAHSPHLAKYASAAAFANLAGGFAQQSQMVEPAVTSPLRCRDPDDQAFLDLAAHCQAPLLLTLDRDLLKLRKRAATLGLNIVQPFKMLA